MNRAVFFDRDGVLNKVVVKDNKPYPPADVKALKINMELIPLCADLRKKGFLLICVTNQPDFARGKCSLENISEINKKISEAFHLDDLLVCLHDNKDNCDCRKPKPGMLVESAKKHDIDLKSSYMVGDRKGDIAAGLAAGCETIFIDYGYDEPKPDNPDITVKTPKEAVEYILDSKI